MRSWLFVASVVSFLALSSSALAQGRGGGQCGGGTTQSAVTTSAVVTGSSVVTPFSAQSSGQSSLAQMLGPTRAYLQTQAVVAAFQAQEREKRLTQHNSVYQQRRAAEVAARANRSNANQPSRAMFAQYSP